MNVMKEMQSEVIKMQGNGLIVKKQEEARQCQAWEAF